jgi:hypothetical protein
MKLVDFGRLAFAVSETQTRHTPPNLDSECIAPIRRACRSVRIWIGPSADHGCTGSIGVVQVERE